MSAKTETISVANRKTKITHVFIYTFLVILALIYLLPLAWVVLTSLKDDSVLGTILDEQWLPSHSAAYREAYHPAYRVISTDWIPCMKAI